MDRTIQDRLKEQGMLLKGIVTFRPSVYTAVAHDPRATGTSGIIIIAVYMLIGCVQAMIAPASTEETTSLMVKLYGIGMFTGYQLFQALFAWVVGGVINTFLATRLFRGTINLAQMMRIIGYVSVFRLLELATIAGGLTQAIFFVWYALLLIGHGVGIRAVAKIDAPRAAATAVLAGVPMYFLMILITYVIKLLFFTLDLPLPS
ncbi:MAG: hypothetical protein HC884_07240 [Chloroflexaceae bacterium]|nr:hypothetical protein [Chloroflexaceae bacterium]